YTEKRIYLHNRLPTWVQSMLPRVFYIIEKSWNYYPYTLTEYTCSFLPRFLIQIDTTYQDNNGSSENALDLAPDLLEQREVDHVDILSDEFSSRETTPEEDCHAFVSSKTGRGPLQEGWKESTEPIMCSYKAVKVFFEVWGLQTRVEAGVHRAVRDIILKGHKQAFLWIDEWHGLTMEDIREYERKVHEETNRMVLSNGTGAVADGATP
ncbi:PREDICTED: cytoplasmic phosphatidylinositol transfer protein 1-like, partial [Amphimedon queenslandica]|uniref:Phosphatidylinositol transfer protein N-terminal domain-containing protein n=1 Tax=Amphimedon queenslandica TaxID=400682 RepID=A0AAN0IJD9_AMPQE